MNAPAYRSNLNPVFRSKFSEDIFNLKYRHAEAETWDELSKTVAIDVAGQYLHKDELASLIEMIRNQEFIPGGRYLYYAGREVKFFNNCFLRNRHAGRLGESSVEGKIMSYVRRRNWRRPFYIPSHWRDAWTYWGYFVWAYPLHEYYKRTWAACNAGWVASIRYLRFAVGRTR